MTSTTLPTRQPLELCRNLKHRLCEGDPPLQGRCRLLPQDTEDKTPKAKPGHSSCVTAMHMAARAQTRPAVSVALTRRSLVESRDRLSSTRRTRSASWLKAPETGGMVSEKTENAAPCSSRNSHPKFRKELRRGDRRAVVLPLVAPSNSSAGEPL